MAPEKAPGRVEIAYNVDGGHKPWVDATCNQIRKNLGVDCVGNPQPKFSEMLTKLEQKQPVGAFRMGWIFDYPAMENYLGPLYSTHGSSNYYGYSNPEFDKLLAEGDASVWGGAGIYETAASTITPLSHSCVCWMSATPLSLRLSITASILISSMIADVVENSELKTGRRSEGLFFAAASFVNKAVSGIGIFASSLILLLIAMIISVMNFIITSGSAMWSLAAPIFVMVRTPAPASMTLLSNSVWFALPLSVSTSLGVVAPVSLNQFPVMMAPEQSSEMCG